MLLKKNLTHHLLRPNRSKTLPRKSKSLKLMKGRTMKEKLIETITRFRSFKSKLTISNKEALKGLIATTILVSKRKLAHKKNY